MNRGEDQSECEAKSPRPPHQETWNLAHLIEKIVAVWLGHWEKDKREEWWRYRKIYERAAPQSEA
jgi:hypothetical protein